MASKKPKLIFQVLMGILFLSFVAACNNESDEKATVDTTAVKTDTMPAMMAPIDTTKMDTASTREPVKPSD